MTELATTVPLASSEMPTWLRYWKLAKYRIDVHLGLFLAWSLLPWTRAFETRSLAIFALSFVSIGTGACAGIVLDDVNGFRDGSDAKNYTEEDGVGYRPRSKKPLVVGLLTVSQALRFAIVLASISGASMIGVWFVAGFEPWWILLPVLATGALSTQYSYGLKLSYRGLQDLVLLLTFLSTVVLPYGLVMGTISTAALVVGVLLGLWDVQVVQFSNIPDAESDRAVKRRTMAVVLSGDGHRRLIRATFLLIWLGSAAAVVTGLLPGIALLALVPAFATHLGALRAGLKDDPRLAYEGRIRGWTAMRWWTAGIVVANVFAQWAFA